MTQMEFPALPDGVQTTFTPPQNTDLYWLSLASYMYCQVLKALRNAGVNVFQSDATDVTNLNAMYQAALADFQTRTDALLE
jgi:hypothetical protein